MSKKKAVVKPDLILMVHSGCVVSAISSIEGVMYQVDDRDEGGLGSVVAADNCFPHRASRARLIELLGETIPNMICEELQEEIQEVLRKESI